MQWLLDNLVCYVKTAFTFVLNETVEAIGALYGVMVGALPAMPGYPDTPAFVVTAMEWAYYIFDVGWILGYVATFFVLMGALFLVMIPLRWIKAVDA